VLQFYGFGSVDVVKSMPLKTFWMLHRNIDRLEAQADYRQLMNLISAVSTEGVKARQEALQKTIGNVYILERSAQTVHVIEEQLDRVGLERLRGTGRLR
jgi:hypothetical protein